MPMHPRQRLHDILRDRCSCICCCHRPDYGSWVSIAPLFLNVTRRQGNFSIFPCECSWRCALGRDKPASRCENLRGFCAKNDFRPRLTLCSQRIACRQNPSSPQALQGLTMQILVICVKMQAQRDCGCKANDALRGIATDEPVLILWRVNCQMQSQ